MITQTSTSLLLLLTLAAPAFADKAADKVLDDCVEATKKLKTLSVEYVVSATLPDEPKPQIIDKNTLYFQIPDRYYFYNDSRPTDRQWITFFDGKDHVAYNMNDKIFSKNLLKEPVMMSIHGENMFVRPELIKKLAKKGTTPTLLKPVKVKDEMCQVVKIEGDFGTHKFYFSTDKLVKLYISEEFGVPSKLEIKSIKKDAELPQDKINWKVPAGAKPDPLGKK